MSFSLIPVEMNIIMFVHMVILGIKAEMTDDEYAMI